MRCCNVLVIPSVRLLQLQLHIDFANTYHPPSDDFLKYAGHKTNHTSCQPFTRLANLTKYPSNMHIFIYFQLLQTEAVIVTMSHQLISCLELLVHNRGSHNLGTNNLSN